MNLFHHFHLDDGLTAFNSDPVVAQKQLKGYLASSFLKVVPAYSSERLMQGQKVFMSPTAAGFELFVAAKETAPDSNVYTTIRGVDESLMLYFLLYVIDPLFENYSTVSAVNEQPFYFSNQKPSGHAGTFNYINVTATTPIADYTISQASFAQVAQQLNPKELRGLFGIIGIRMRGDDTFATDGEVRDLLQVNGDLEVNPPTFKIQFDNRRTIWQYKDAQDGSLIHSSDPTTLPLVKRGIVGYSFSGQDRPAARPDRLLYEKDNNGTIIKTFSEIYI